MLRIYRFPLLFLILIVLTGWLSEASGQNTGAPEAMVEIFDDLKLGVRAYGGVQSGRQTVFPLENRDLKYLQRPVDGTLSYSVPYVGAGVALRFRGAELAFTLRKDRTGKSWAQFENESDAFPYSTSIGQSSLRAQYFFRDWIGAGAALRGWTLRFNSFGVGSYEVSGKEVSSGSPFHGRFWRTLWTLYVPVRAEWKGIRFFGRAGLSVYGTNDEEYDASFVAYQSPENPGQKTVDGAVPPAVIDPGDDDPVNAQFGRVGAAIPVWRTTVRAQIEVMRGHSPDLSRTWSYDVQLEVGLPF